MAVTERAELDRLSVPERLTAFGLDLALAHSEQGDRNGARPVRWELVPPAAIDRAWRGAESVRVVDFRFEDGRPMLSVDHDPDRGYRIHAPRFGRHLVSPDGAEIRSALPRLAPWRWQRLFYAQVLPLAAALQGLELFHASAVAVDGGVVAFVAESGTGKTSVAAHLVAAGARLVTDDVLALELVSGHVRAFPGPGMTSVDPAEMRSMTAAGRLRLGRPIGRDDKIHLATETVDEPLPLEIVYLLRRGGGEGVQISRRVGPAARSLLASSFLRYVRTPERLLTHLDVCASLARSTPAFDLIVPENVSARDAAARIQAHAAELLSR